MKEIQGPISGFEFKWNPKRKITGPKTFRDAYQADITGVTSENFRDFVLPQNVSAKH